jgi:hypothetical protein
MQFFKDENWKLRDARQFTDDARFYKELAISSKAHDAERIKRLKEDRAYEQRIRTAANSILQPTPRRTVYVADELDENDNANEN